MGRAFDVTTSTAASVLRWTGGLGASHPVKTQPEKLLELYEFEACPFCRKLREALTAFDLDAKIFPCPKGGPFRDIVRERGGKEQFPYLVDPNTGTAMYESMGIIDYLAKTYGDGTKPLLLSLGPLTTLGAGLAGAMRAGRGGRSRPSKPPPLPLELWSYDASPYSRLARETLCELSLPYVLHNVGKGSSKRAAFVERSGKMRVPYLVDPNTDTAMFESGDIVAYLDRTYAA
jgi:glutathione S-transferase